MIPFKDRTMLAKAECGHTAFFCSFDILMILGNTIDISYAVREVAVQMVTNIISYCESPPFVYLTCEELRQSSATTLQVYDDNRATFFFCQPLTVPKLTIIVRANPIVTKY